MAKKTGDVGKEVKMAERTVIQRKTVCKQSNLSEKAGV